MGLCPRFRLYLCFHPRPQVRARAPRRKAAAVKNPRLCRPNSRRVQNDERAERAERRRERREEMMDEADAINRAYGNRKVYILH